MGAVRQHRIGVVSGAGVPVADIVTAIEHVVGPKGMLLADGDMQPFLEDWWGRVRGDALCVVLPANVGEVSAVVVLCARYGVPIYPQGGNTSVCAGSIPPSRSGGIVLGLARMSAILDVNAADNAITVEAGCILTKVQEAALAVDRLFPLSLGAEGSCQIGGNIATNAGGTGVLRYGNMRDLVLGLQVVLPDGRIWNGLRSLRKNNSGYDLRNLFIGAEGTLGIVTAATLKLFPAPPHIVTALFALNTAAAAVGLGSHLGSAFPSELTALELLSASQVRLVLAQVPGNACPVSPDAPWFVLIDLASTAEPQEMADRLGRQVETAIEDATIIDAVIATSEAQRAALWRLRHSVTEANKKEGMGFSHDVAVPVFSVAEFIDTTGQAVARTFPQAEVVIVGHLGDGNMHYNVMFNHAVWDQVTNQAEVRHAVNQLIYDQAAAYRGTFSAEHGIGALHMAEMARYKDPVELDLMHGIKRHFDPAGLMNPGRVLPSMTRFCQASGQEAPSG